MRRLLLLLPPLFALAGVLLALGIEPGAADDGPAPAVRAGTLVDARTIRAAELGTRYLLRLQQPDGSWHSDAGKKVNETYRVFEEGRDVPHVGVTALALLALLAGGNMPGRGPHGEAMDKGINFLIKNVQRSGYISAHKTRMYSHAFATLALAEIYGASRRKNVRVALQDAVEFTVKSQNGTGGWRYVPFTNDSDMSITVCQVVALRAARNVGIKVPRQTIDRALKYVIESAITNGDRGPTGAFWYQPFDQSYNRPSFALCAAGLTTLFQAGLYDDDALRRHIKAHNIPKSPPPSIERSVAYMKAAYDDIYRRSGRGGPEHFFFYYGNYYAAQAMYQIGGTNPAAWSSWYTQVRDHLLGMMRSSKDPETGEPEAFWRSNVDSTHAYATSCALLILQFPLDHLPIHQR
jgi:hypothetical protein